MWPFLAPVMPDIGTIWKRCIWCQQLHKYHTAKFRSLLFFQSLVPVPVCNDIQQNHRHNGNSYNHIRDKYSNSKTKQITLRKFRHTEDTSSLIGGKCSNICDKSSYPCDKHSNITGKYSNIWWNKRNRMGIYIFEFIGHTQIQDVPPPYWCGRMLAEQPASSQDKVLLTV